MQKGFIHPLYLLILTILGLILFWIIAYNLPLKDKLLGLLFPKQLSEAQQIEPTHNLTELNEKLITLNREYRQTSTSNANDIQDKKLAELLAVAKQRRESLKKLIQADPDAFLYFAKAHKQSFPQTVQSDIEDRVQIEGEFTHLHADNFEEKKSEDSYFVKSNDKKYQLYFPRNFQPKIPYKSKVKVTGYQIDEQIVVESTPSENIQIVDSPTNTTAVPSQMKLATIVVKFNSAASSSANIADVQKAVFGPVGGSKQYYKEVSYDSLDLSGDVIGPLTITTPDSLCHYQNWMNEALVAATTSGVNLSNYTHYMLVFPYTYPCGFSGLAELGGQFSWINGNTYPDVYSHELGHNLGFYHANFLNCHTKSIDDYANCDSLEYEDPMDVMGFWGHYHTNTINKASRGWLPNTKVQTITQSGSYTVGLAETVQSGYQALKIPKTDTGDSYYLEYRQPIGFDTDLALRGFTTGASLRINTGTYTQLIDPRSEQLNFSYGDHAYFSDNTVFRDLMNNITITQLNHSPNGVTLQITTPEIPTNQFIPEWQAVQLPSGGEVYSTSRYVAQNGFLYSFESIFETVQLIKIAVSSLSPDGTPGAWTPIGNYAEPPYGFSVFAKNGYVYLMGQSYDAFDQAYINFKGAKINNDGTLGAWQPQPVPPTLPYGLKTVVSGNYVYAFGYRSNASAYTPYPLAAQLNANGTVGQWMPVSTYPLALDAFGVATARGYIYVTGGYDMNINKANAQTYYAKTNSDGTLGSWQTTTRLNSATDYLNLASHGDTLFALGGIAPSGQAVNRVMASRSNLDGTLSTWSVSTELPATLSQASVTTTNRAIYMGGQNLALPKLFFAKPQIFFPGDPDQDGDVDIFDYNMLLRDYGKTGKDLLGDLDQDGDVDIFDYNIVLRDYGKSQ